MAEPSRRRPLLIRVRKLVTLLLSPALHMESRILFAPTMLLPAGPVHLRRKYSKNEQGMAYFPVRERNNLHLSAGRDDEH
jgi:hypothetical protein